MFKNTKKQGDWGVGVAIAYFATEGYTISIPLTDSQDYDLVVDIGNQLKRVQVKSTTYKGDSNYYRVSFTIKGGNRSGSTIKRLDTSKVDLIFIVTAENDKYLIPSTHVGQSCTLNSTYDIFKV